MLIDSLDITDDGDRQRIVESCRTCADDRIVVTHGTDTMVETAAVLARGTERKTIVLTGAMVPSCLRQLEPSVQSRKRAFFRASLAAWCVRGDERQGVPLEWRPEEP